MPLYVKAHSYGEYVFDWAWADAYERHGMRLLPEAALRRCRSRRRPGRGCSPRRTQRAAQLARAVLDARARSEVVVAARALPGAEDAQALRAGGMLERARRAVPLAQRRLRDFEDFLGALSHDKRKKIRQERQRVARRGRDASRA